MVKKRSEMTWESGKLYRQKRVDCSERSSAFWKP